MFKISEDDAGEVEYQRFVKAQAEQEREEAEEAAQVSSDDEETEEEQTSDCEEVTRSGRSREPLDFGAQAAAAGGQPEEVCEGVRKVRVLEGKGAVAAANAQMDVQYVVRVGDRVVDVSYGAYWNNDTCKVRLGERTLIAGIERALRTMQRREKARFWIDSALAYGEEGSPPLIAPGDDLVVDVWCLRVFNPTTGSGLHLRDHEVISYCFQQRDLGNALYKKGEWHAAMREYKRGIKADKYIAERRWKDRNAPVLKLLQLNIAAAHLKLGRLQRCIKYCTEVLRGDPKNVKALYRRALAYKETSERVEDARLDLIEAIRLDPQNRQLRQELEVVRGLIASKRKEVKESFGSFFEEKKESLYRDKLLPRVFMELSVGSKPLGRLEIELFSDKAPRAAENFRALCTGEKGDGLHYRGTTMHRIIPKFIIQGGDVDRKRGKGGRSIYGKYFDDEQGGLDIKQDKRGLVVMASSGPNKNQSQFYITLAACPTMDGRAVVVGRVVAGRQLLSRLEQVETGAKDRPVDEVRIFKSGVVAEKSRMDDDDSE